jgi:hypothetical protein
VKIAYLEVKIDYSAAEGLLFGGRRFVFRRVKISHSAGEGLLFGG